MEPVRGGVGVPRAENDRQDQEERNERDVLEDQKAEGRLRALRIRVPQIAEALVDERRRTERDHASERKPRDPTELEDYAQPDPQRDR